MTEQLKAEAYVRKQRPALYKTFLGSNTPRPQTINLQDWLAVLRNHCEQINYVQLNGTDYITFMPNKHPYKTMLFNLTTGQPATEADYKAFNETVK